MANSPPRQGSNTPKVAMYSYKGGAGRTVATANVAALLAKEFGRKVVLLDLDIESAGMAVVLGVHQLVARRQDRYALQDLLERDVRLTSADRFMQDYWPKLAIDVGKHLEQPGLGDRFWFLPSRPAHHNDVSLVGKSVHARLQQIVIYVQLAVHPDIILIDSAAGLAGPAVMSMELADSLFTFMRWTEQFVEGTSTILNWLREENSDIANFFLVPSAVPSIAPGELEFQEGLTRQRARLQMELTEGANAVTILDDIPESRRLKWRERIFCFEDVLLEDDRRVLAAYRKLATALDGLCGK